MAEMTKWERVRAALHGEDVDRPPVGFWRHYYLLEWNPQRLAEAMVGFVREFNWDYLKVNPRATYYAEAWGAQFDPSNNPLQGPTTRSYPLKSADDLRKIEPVDVHVGPFGEQLQALRRIAELLGGETPFIQTVFNPLSVIGRLTDTNLLQVRQWMREAPDALHGALATVAQTLAAYARASLEAGAAGIFFATVEWATRDATTVEDYQTFARPYDLQVLAAVQDAEFNVLHVCRENNMLTELLDYPVHAFNWAETSPTNPSFADILPRTDKAVLGGIDQGTIGKGDQAKVLSELQEALRQTGGTRYLVGPGCSIPPDTPEANLRAVIDFLESGRKASV